jgi:hypothetical protein
MEHFYEKIEGWFDFQDIYTQAVNAAGENAHFVEVGSWFGKSTIFMAVEIANSNKKIRFDAIDHWEGSPGEMKEHGGMTPMNQYINDNSVESAFMQFINNIEPCKDYINVVRGDSSLEVLKYEDNSLDFVFIDSDHSYDSIKKEVINWWPKIKNGGIIGGHDYNYISVCRAVNEVLSDLGLIKVSHHSWYVKK